MADVYNPQHWQRNRNAMLSQAGVNMYGSGARDYSNRVAKPQGGGGKRSGYQSVGSSAGIPGLGVGGGGASIPSAVNGGQSVGGVAGAYQSALDSANAANEARYAEGHQGYTDLRSRTLADLAKQGDQGRKDINEQFNNFGQTQAQNLISRGLSASTAGLAPLALAERERSGAISRYDEGLRRERIGYDVDLTRDLLGFVERREDEAPDLGQMLQLQNQMGESGGGLGNSLANAFGGGFGQVGFNNPMAGYGGGYGYSSGSGQGGGLNATQRNALLANKGKLKYNSGYSLGGATASQGSKGPSGYGKLGMPALPFEPKYY
jgi:hypothetical protein